MFRLLCTAFLSITLLPAAVTVQFSTNAPDVGPFPSDAFTVADSTQKSGVRVNIPLPDCMQSPSTCNELNLVNQLDGFNVNPRLLVKFSGAVDTTTLGAGVWYIALDNITNDEPGIHKPGDTIKTNQGIWDVAKNTFYAKPDVVLDQHRHYAIVVTDAVKDASGAAVAADPAFTDCASGNGGNYCATLAGAMAALSAKVAPARIVSAAVFTTLSATAWIESVRAQLDVVPPAPTMLQGTNTFKLADLKSITLNEQTGVNPVKLEDTTLPLEQFAPLLAGLGAIAMGTYQSPYFLDDSQTVPPTATGAPASAPTAVNTVYFNVLLPDAPRPDGGWPVVIFGHGFGDSRFGGPTAVAPVMANAGFAVIAINASGHGYGPASTVTFVDKSGNKTVLPSGGRGRDMNGDGVIESNEGCAVMLPPVAIGLRDCLRQTAVDLMQLVKAIQAGIDVDGDGVPDLDATHIYYAGQSLGSLYGTILNALEPNVRAAALNVGGGSVGDIARWSPGYRSLTLGTLAQRTPSLLNNGKSYNEDYVLRDVPVKSVSTPGAIDVQNYLETIEWLDMPGDPLAFAPHLKPSPLAGTSPRNILVQFAFGDQTVPNPTNSALIRAANLQSNAWLYRHDRARVFDPLLPANPHAFLVMFASGDSLQLADQLAVGISVFTQQQVADFFTADGQSISDPNNQAILQLVNRLLGGPLFEVPKTLPETLNF